MSERPSFPEPLMKYLPQPPTYPLDWVGLNRFTWVQELKGVPQDPEYHAEGDVWIHTRMVLEALGKMEGWRKSGQSERGLLFWSALMHDIAKPLCTREDERGRIVSPKHAVRGAQMARQLMWEGLPTVVPFEARERIAGLVRYHGLPLWFMEKEDPEKALVKASLGVSLERLARLAEADVRGRICRDQEELLERVELFRMQAKELGCYQQPYPFESDLARFTYFQKKGSPLSYVPYDDTRNEVILMCGLPGAGKDHWIRHQGPGWSVISLDEMRKESGIGPRDNQGRLLQAAKERAREYLRREEPFIWNATNLQRSRRKALVSLFTTYKARVRIVYVEAPFPQLFAQNQEREDSVPEAVLQRFIRRLEVPDLSEAHRVSWEV
jgi:putative nucleotidyltransferase with HDIG domain